LRSGLDMRGFIAPRRALLRLGLSNITLGWSGFERAVWLDKRMT